ncbi:hypothetical protein WJ92_02925 [Burkholderia ubonensis]|uniref:DUF2514 family protein n=1 Tax=Burkholderia ubonensis TaxID=101571 RepID=UPI000752E345|nr:DUF2514 family protein [Burkholderia ubonensis]KVP77549.1 hypothetical protein WJ92_02925 [Burkholderia ubonensis]
MILLKSAWPYLLAALLGAAAGAGVEHLISARRLADVQAAAATTQVKAVEAARAEEQRRIAAQQEVAKNAAQQRDQARADAAAAASAADGLRKQVAVLVAGARHPATTSGSQATGDALDLLADVLGRADQRAGELAEYADRVRIAGQQCERDYDALTQSR